ncbi:MFS transporter [Paenibacillus sp. GSMTC-2017]|uniref:MFS transporter n=1 Tax=Paenibacillus sp. GSMTC-2017 TaxID=2794350 RepID=UPI0018D5E740|nr:MFS transporter [Paenibacillus sp. GSMTC-2017]MBH5317009.1 MFS transporter [Paenibacillus sp. GSMTC-2017]
MFNLLRNRLFLIYWLSGTLGTVASIFITVGLMSFIYSKTNSILGATTILLASYGADFVGSFLSSHFIHKFNYGKLIIVIQFSRTLNCLALFALLGFSQSTNVIIIIFILKFLADTFAAWDLPARQVILRTIVPREQYLQARSTLNVVRQCLMIGGWSLGGILTAYFSFQSVLIGASLLYFVSACCLFAIRGGLYATNVEEAENDDISKADTSNNNKENPNPPKPWNTLVQNKTVRQLLFIDLIEMVANTIWTSSLLLAFTKIVLNKDEQWWGMLNASYFVGSIIGGALLIGMATWFDRRIGYVIGLSSLTMAISTFLMTYYHHPIFALVAVMLIGPLYEIRETCQEALFQDSVPHHTLANTLSARSTILSPWNALATFGVAYFAEINSIEAVFYVASGIYFSVFLIVFLQPQLRRKGSTRRATS